jgi:hypothetical protein
MAKWREAAKGLLDVADGGFRTQLKDSVVVSFGVHVHDSPSCSKCATHSSKQN